MAVGNKLQDVSGPAITDAPAGGRNGSVISNNHISGTSGTAIEATGAHQIVLGNKIVDGGGDAIDSSLGDSIIAFNQIRNNSGTAIRQAGVLTPTVIAGNVLDGNGTDWDISASAPRVSGNLPQPPGYGPVVQSPDGTVYQIEVANDGTVSTTAL
jgi:hypothetical protein